MKKTFLYTIIFISISIFIKNIANSNDIKLVNAEPGLWTVNFIAGNGCSYTADFTIQTALKIYNGVSANADGRNDYFFVDCIDYFPNNKVQIFNRDGTLVWKTPSVDSDAGDSYDNVSVRFEGFSNVGRSVNVITNEVINPKVIIHPKSIIG